MRIGSVCSDSICKFSYAVECHEIYDYRPSYFCELVRLQQAFHCSNVPQLFPIILSIYSNFQVQSHQVSDNSIKASIIQIYITFPRGLMTGLKSR